MRERKQNKPSRVKPGIECSGTAKAPGGLRVLGLVPALRQAVARELESPVERTIIAYVLMAILVAAGIGVGLYLRHNSRERVIRRHAARKQSARQARSVAKNG